MSGRPLDITQRQVRALCEGAKKAGFVPVIRVGNLLVQLVPEDRAIPAAPTTPVDGDEPTPSAAYEQWKAGRHARAS